MSSPLPPLVPGDMAILKFIEKEMGRLPETPNEFSKVVRNLYSLPEVDEATVAARMSQKLEHTPMELLHQVIMDFFNHGSRAASLSAMVMVLHALRGLTTIDLDDPNIPGRARASAEHDYPWTSAHLSASIVMLYATPNSHVDMVVTLKFLNTALSNMSRRLQTELAKTAASADLARRFKVAKTAALNGKVGKVTVIAVNLIDLLHIDLSAYAESNHTSYEHAFALVVGREGWRIYQANGAYGHGYEFWKNLMAQGCRPRTWAEGTTFMKAFSKIVKQKGPWTAEINTSYKECFCIDLDEVCKARSKKKAKGGNRRKEPQGMQEYHPWVSLLELHDVRSEQILKFTWETPNYSADELAAAVADEDGDNDSEVSTVIVEDSRFNEAVDQVHTTAESASDVVAKLAQLEITEPDQKPLTEPEVFTPLTQSDPEPTAQEPQPEDPQPLPARRPAILPAPETQLFNEPEETFRPLRIKQPNKVPIKQQGKKREVSHAKSKQTGNTSNVGAKKAKKAAKQRAAVRRKTFKAKKAGRKSRKAKRGDSGSDADETTSEDEAGDNVEVDGTAGNASEDQQAQDQAQDQDQPQEGVLLENTPLHPGSNDSEDPLTARGSSSEESEEKSDEPAEDSNESGDSNGSDEHVSDEHSSDEHTFDEQYDDSDQDAPEPARHPLVVESLEIATDEEVDRFFNWTGEESKSLSSYPHMTYYRYH
ncbi:hypothetical protein BJX99DRAFT_259550 [Aspergillus californicus]